MNVASKCGYTASGYALLSKIAEMKDQGVEVAIFPCNQFGGQEVNELLFDYILICYASDICSVICNV